MNPDHMLEDGQTPADVGNTLIAQAVLEHARCIAELATQADRDFGLYLDPEDESWGVADDTPVALLTAWLALRDAADGLRDVVGKAEDLVADALGRQEVIVGESRFRAKRTPRRKFPAEKASELRDVMRRTIARKIALNPLTGELDEDRARVAGETIDAVDRWQSLRPASFKTTTLKQEGVDVDEYAETEWSVKIAEAPL